MKKIGMQEFQEESEVEAFNLIGQDAGTKGYDIVYFKTLMPKLVKSESDYEFEYKHMHYIHLIKDDDVQFSIYFDEFGLGSILPGSPYYELYDRFDIERFFEEDVEELFKRIKELI
ncbi:MAG: hypothetical protein ACRCXT_15770 [Paraclostridium sp.]